MINEDKIQDIIDGKLEECELFLGVRDRKLRIIVEMKMREMYHLGLNHRIECEQKNVFKP